MPRLGAAIGYGTMCASSVRARRIGRVKVEMKLFDALGFRWERAAIPSGMPTYSLERVCFRVHKMLPEFVWDAGVLEGNW